MNAPSKNNWTKKGIFIWRILVGCFLKIHLRRESKNERINRAIIKSDKKGANFRKHNQFLVIIIEP